MNLNYKKIWKRETMIAKILATIISIKRKIGYRLHYFKINKWYHLINKIQIFGINKIDIITIIRLRQIYKNNTKIIMKKTGLSHNKVMAVLFYYKCWKISDWKDLYFNIIEG